jgi:hypothetical protein
VLCLSAEPIEHCIKKDAAMATLDVSELVDRLERIISQATTGREEDFTAVHLLLKEALDTARQLSEKQPPRA